jgi:hypothetical protein
MTPAGTRIAEPESGDQIEEEEISEREASDDIVVKDCGELVQLSTHESRGEHCLDRLDVDDLESAAHR